MKLTLKKNTVQFGAGVVALLLVLFFFYQYPLILRSFLVLALPGFLVSYVLVKDEITLLERLILALPLTSLFLVFVRALAYVGVPVTPMLVGVVVMIVPILLTMLEYEWLHTRFTETFCAKGKFSSRKAREYLTKHAWTLLVVAVVLFISASLWNPLYQGEKLPLSDQVVNQYTIDWLSDSIIDHNHVPLWASDASGGLPFILFDSYFYYEHIMAQHLVLPLETITFTQNMFAFFASFLLSLGLVALGRRLGMSLPMCVLSVVVFLSNPFLASKFGYSGDMKELSTFALIPIWTIFFLLAQKNPRNYIGVALIGAVLYHYHMVSFVLHALFLVGIFLMYKIVHKKTVTKKELKYIGLAALIVGGIIAYHALPFGINLEYASSENWKSSMYWAKYKSYFIDPLFKDSTPGIWSPGLNTYYTMLSMLGLLATLYFFIKAKKRKEHWSTPIMIVFGGFFLCYISFMIPGLKGLVSRIGPDRIILLYFMMGALLVPQLMRLSKHKAFKVIVAVVILYVIMGPSQLNQHDFAGWVNEQAQNGMFQEYYANLDARGPGRVITYGIYFYAIEPMIPVWSKSLGMISHTNPVGARTYPQEDLKDESESFPNMENGIPFIINRLRTTFTPYVFIFKCDRGRRGDVTEQLFAYYAQEQQENIGVLAQDECVSILEIPNAHYAEGYELSRIALEKEQLYNLNKSWHVMGFHNEEDYDRFNIQDTIASQEDVLEVPQPEVYEYTWHNEDHVTVSGTFSEGQWVSIKDHFFPSWHAYQNGQELEIVESHLGTMLVQAQAGSHIDFINKPFSYEVGAAVAAALTVLAVFVLMSSVGARFFKRKK